MCGVYFVSMGSTVFLAALDAKRAFDRVRPNHVKLFLWCTAHVTNELVL